MSMPKLCIVSCCGNRAQYRPGLCSGHRKAQQAGRPLGPLRRSWSAEQVFQHFVHFDVESGCHLWTGRMNPEGYGLISAWSDGTLAHRYAYTYANGPIPDGLVVDHLCRQRRCVNPAHLEAVTFGENVRRGAGPGQSLWAPATHCRNGHELSSENIYTSPSKPNERMCRQCRRQRSRERRERLRLRARS